MANNFDLPIRRSPVRRRLALFGVIGCGVAMAAALVLTALSDNLEYFRSPTDVHLALESKEHAPISGRFRLGGMVREASYVRKAGTLDHSFRVTDFSHDVVVHYQGALPDLFREGQGIVAVGRISKMGDDKTVFQADEVLAKHDENYMPPEVAAAMGGSGQDKP